MAHGSLIDVRALRIRTGIALVLGLFVWGGITSYQKWQQRTAPGAPRGGRTPLSISPPAGIARLPAIRVCLTAAPSETSDVSVMGPVTLTLAGTNQVLWRGSSLPDTRVTVSPRGFLLGTQRFPVSRLDINPGRDGTLGVNGHEYRGRLRLIRTSETKLRIINLVPLEDYVASVVDGEMPREFGDEARKAQAIVARTYALYEMLTAGEAADFDLFASTRSQKYNGLRYRDGQGRWLAGESTSSRQIALQTAGMVCTYQGRIFCTYYSATCGGQTSQGSDFFENAGPVQRSIPCTWCAEATRYRWTASLPQAELQRKVTTYFTNQGKRFGALRTIRTGQLPHLGGVSEVTLGDGRTQETMPATLFRRIVGTDRLYSHKFSVSFAEGSWRFQGMGYGHGVGLCQWGARGQAHGGRTGLQILAYYYPGSEVVVLRD